MLTLYAHTGNNCALATLATFLGRPYSTVLKTAKKLVKNPEQKGMYMTDMIRIARKFNVHLKQIRSFDASVDGILSVENYASGWVKAKGAKEAPHVVVVWKGLVFDSIGPSVWTPGQYKRCNKSKFYSMLVRK
jgi:hypothetical protein